MSLNIKNPEAHQIARKLATLTGESVTAAVTVALRERLERVERQHEGSLAERLLAIGEECAEYLPEHLRTVDHGEMLYDDQGLPH